MSLANVLTLSRIPLAAAVVWAWLQDLPGITLACMAAILITDLLDGRVARATGRASDRGALLDSGVDWVVIYGLYASLLFVGSNALALLNPMLVIPALLVTLIGGVLILVRHVRLWRTTTSAARAKTRWGKPLGAVQYGWLFTFFVYTEMLRGGFGWPSQDATPLWYWTAHLLSWGVGLLAVLALLHGWENLKALAAPREAKS